MSLSPWIRMCLLAPAIALAGNAHAQGWQPDTAFNAAGNPLASVPGAQTLVGRAVLAQPDGALLVAGNTADGKNDFGADFLLLRYLPDGSLDTGFGGGGASRVSLGEKRDIAYALLQQPDGKLVAVGGSEGGGAQGSVAVVRYLPDGSLDPAFDGDGVAVTTLNIGNVSALAGALQADGKILAAGHDNAHGFVLVRYNSDGSPDAGFGAGGVVVIKPGPRAWANALLVQADGRVVLAGHSGDGAVIALLRLLPDGALDPSFGDGGIVSTEAGVQRSTASAVTQLADGSLLVAGTTRLDDSSPQQMIALRYLPDGSLDEAFGTGGAVLVPSSEPAAATAVLPQADGKVVLAGYQRTANDRRDPVLVTLSAEGAVIGRQLLPAQGSATIAAAVVQVDGKLVLAGAAADCDGILLQRLQP